MRSIFGRINTDEEDIQSASFNGSLKKLSVTPFTKTEIFIEKYLGFGQIHFHTEKNILPTTFSKKYLLVSDSSIYNKQDLIRDLGLPEHENSDDKIILRSFEKWEEKCVNHLIGDFAFAIWNKNTQELFCARDHLGVKPFHYFFKNEKFVFSSDIQSILAQNDLTLSIDQRQLADTISIVKSEKDRTTYQEIKRLPPAHYLTLKNNILEIKPYWELQKQPVSKSRDTEIINEFKQLLTEAIKCRTLNAENVSCELSGGIDSSTVSAIATKFTDIKTFSHTLPDHLLGKIHPLKDERKYINLLADYCSIKERNFVTSEKSLLKALTDHLDNYKNLSQQNFGIFSDQLYLAAQNNDVKTLLSGFGGDEVVTSKSLEYLTELAEENNWSELKADLKNQFSTHFKYLKALLKVIVKTKLSRIYRILITLKFQKPWWYYKYKNLALNKDFEKRYEIKKRYFNNYNNINNYSLQDRNIERITHPHVSQRLEYCALEARQHGIEYRYPLLDIRLIEYYLSVPPRLKARNGIGRYIIRRAIEGVVPEKIQWRNDKSGATIPTVFMRMLNEHREIHKIIRKAKSNPQIKACINLDAYDKWFHKIKNRTKETKFINPGAFYNYLKVILFIENNPTFFK